MRVEAAVYGEVDNGHALRETTADPDFARAISGRLDIPSTPPFGIAWSPALSGFPTNGRYVLARTFLDLNAARGNMVLVHALFAPLERVRHFGSIARIIGLLATRPEDVRRPSAFEVEDDDGALSAPALRDVAALLASRGKKPVVKLGSDEIEQLVCALWQNLWPGMREQFAFRLSFSPDDVVETPAPSLVYTPPSLEARWQAYPVVGKAVADTSIASAILSGDVDPSTLTSFADGLGLGDCGLTNFPLLARAQALTCSDAGFDELAGGMRVVDALSTSLDDGVAAKAELVVRLARAVPGATTAQIMGLRNFALRTFRDLRPVWDALEVWMRGRELHAAGSALGLLELVAASHGAAEAIEPWQEAVKLGGRFLASREPRAYADAFWVWLSRCPTLVAAVFPLTPDGWDAEASIAAATPKRLRFDTSELREALVHRNWLALHGASLAASEPPEAAARIQLEVDRSPTFLNGLRAALASATPLERVTVAAGADEPRLDLIAGGEVASDRRLLNKLDLNLANAQRIWAAAIGIDAECWRAPMAPATSRNDVLSARLDGRTASGKLIEAFARTPLADLSDYDRRAEVWDRLDPTGAFLDSTSRGWIARTSAGGHVELDPRLEAAILRAPALEVRLDGSSSDVDAALAVIAALHALPEDRATRWFEARIRSSTRLTLQHCERLGIIIRDRQWRGLLGLVKDRVWRQRELRTTLEVCASMLPVYDRWTLGVGATSKEEKWESFAALAAFLYPAGPEDRDVWERSGGRNANLQRNVSGATAWKAALRMVRNGSDPKARDLVSKMLDDHPRNEPLQLASRDGDITGQAKSWGWFGL